MILLDELNSLITRPVYKDRQQCNSKYQEGGQNVNFFLMNTRPILQQPLSIQCPMDNFSCVVLAGSGQKARTPRKREF